MNATTKVTTCPDCIGGEHHPLHDITCLNLETMTTEYCQCPCSMIMKRSEPLFEVGTPVTITAGQHINKTGTILTATPSAATYIVYLPALDTQHYVPVEWVQRMEEN